VSAKIAPPAEDRFFVDRTSFCTRDSSRVMQPNRRQLRQSVIDRRKAVGATLDRYDFLLVA